MTSKNNDSPGWMKLLQDPRAMLGVVALITMVTTGGAFTLLDKDVDPEHLVHVQAQIDELKLDQKETKELFARLIRAHPEFRP